MDVITQVDDKNQLTIITVTGMPSFEESMEAFRQLYQGKVTQKMLWDFRQANLSGISSNHIESLLDYIGQHAQKRTNGKTAIVVSKDLEYGMSRMIMALTEDKAIPVEIDVFRSIEVALQWLAKED